MNIAKRICIYMLCGLMTFSSVAMSHYQAVYAMEWVEGALTVAEALKWVLGMLGIITTAGAVGDQYFWGEKEEEFVQFVDENYETVGPNVREWLEKLSKGVLDKGSEVWNAFKAWASTLTSDSSSGSPDSVNMGFVQGMNVLDCVTNISNYFDCTLNTSFSDEAKNKKVYAFGVRVEPNNNFSYAFLCTQNTDFHISGNYGRIYSPSLSQISFYTFRFSPSGNFAYYEGQSNSGFDLNGHLNNFYTDNIVVDSSFNPSKPYIIVSSSGLAIDSDFVAVKKDVTDLDPVSSITGDDSADAEVAIPMPGLAGSDDAASSDAYDDIIAGYNDGTVSLPDTIKEIQEVTKVIVIDDTDDTVFPTLDGEEPVSKDDALQDIKDNMGFTIAGLETVFPFCIPWDIYAFLSLLEAKPVAPSFQFPFRNPVTKKDVMYTVDLSPFNDVAVVIRYGFDLIFIVGLAIATRSLIGAGGDS